MLTFRGVSSLIWSLTAFMLAAALALHVRYRPLADESSYLDTWTGSIRSAQTDLSAADGPVAQSQTKDAAGVTERLETIIHLQSHPHAGRAALQSEPCVRFAFPAPGSAPAVRPLVRR